MRKDYFNILDTWITCNWRKYSDALEGEWGGENMGNTIYFCSAKFLADLWASAKNLAIFACHTKLGESEMSNWAIVWEMLAFFSGLELVASLVASEWTGDFLQEWVDLPTQSYLP